jgi:hypothetical protein
MNTLANTLKQRTPWYREPWPWILMSGPLIVVAAGLFTAWIAYTRGDPVLTEDYYLKGLAAPQTLASNARAQELGLHAAVRLSADDVVSVTLSAGNDFLPPPTIRLTLSHPTRAGLDQTQTLHRDGDRYRGRLHLPQSGHWLLLIENDASGAEAWRMLGKVVLPATEVKIDATAS